MSEKNTFAKKNDEKKVSRRFGDDGMRYSHNCGVKMDFENGIKNTLARVEEYTDIWTVRKGSLDSTGDA